MSSGVAFDLQDKTRYGVGHRIEITPTREPKGIGESRPPLAARTAMTFKLTFGLQDHIQGERTMSGYRPETALARIYQNSLKRSLPSPGGLFISMTFDLAFYLQGQIQRQSTVYRILF